MLPLGTAAPPFALPDVVSGETISLETFADKKALLVMFLCRHCKYVQHVKQALTTLGQDYQGTDLGIVAISANDASVYAEDAPESLKAMAAAEAFTFPYCYDETWPNYRGASTQVRNPGEPSLSMTRLYRNKSFAFGRTICLALPLPRRYG